MMDSNSKPIDKLLGMQAESESKRKRRGRPKSNDTQDDIDYVSFALRYPKDLHQQVKILAIKHNTSTGRMIQQFIKEGIQRLD